MCPRIIWQYIRQSPRECTHRLPEGGRVAALEEEVSDPGEPLASRNGEKEPERIEDDEERREAERSEHRADDVEPATVDVRLQVAVPTAACT